MGGESVPATRDDGSMVASMDQSCRDEEDLCVTGVHFENDDCAAFAAKMRSAVGPGSSFELKRLAFEVYDFAQDVRRNSLEGTGRYF